MIIPKREWLSKILHGYATYIDNVPHMLYCNPENGGTGVMEVEVDGAFAPLTRARAVAIWEENRRRMAFEQWRTDYSAYDFLTDDEKICVLFVQHSRLMDGRECQCYACALKLIVDGEVGEAKINEIINRRLASVERAISGVL
jgi:hypothetical protein